MAPPQPRALPEELVEDILLRFPPDDPARLAHAALVCKPWCAIVAGAGFRRRFRKFHRRAPPLLGFVSNSDVRTHPGDSDSDGAVHDLFHDLWIPDTVYGRTHRPGDHRVAEFFTTCSWPGPPVCRRIGRAVDAHHGRVLLHRKFGWDLPWSSVLIVWDPTTDMQEEVPISAVGTRSLKCLNWTAAVLCAAGGSCDHLDCHQGPFLIVFVCYVNSTTEIYTYSSSAASWSKPISNNQLTFRRNNEFMEQAAHVHGALYFGVRMSHHILKFDLESQEISWIQLPTACCREWSYVLTTTESGGLGVAAIHEFYMWSRDDVCEGDATWKLYMWSRDDVSEDDATWTQSRVIDLKTLLPVRSVFDDSSRVLGSTVGTGVVFVESNDVLFAIDLNLKTSKVIKEVSEAREVYNIVPYMSFYTPAMEVPSKDDKPGEGALRDVQ